MEGKQMHPVMKRPALGGILTLGAAFGLGVYFTLAAVQGDFGLFRKAQILSEVAELRAEEGRLLAKLEQTRNLTKRLSDQYLDLDLLDQQARDMLGYVRGDEIVIR